MAHKRFNDVSIKYNLHIEHINFARREFETQASEFIENQEKSIEDFFKHALSDVKTIEVRNPNVDTNKRTTNLTTFWKQINFTVYSLKKDYQRFMNSGRFTSNLYFDQDENLFVWNCTFDNSDFLDASVDERASELIQSGKYPRLSSSQHIKNDTIVFFKIPVDDNFPENHEEYLKDAVEVLGESLLLSPNLMTEEELSKTEVPDLPEESIDTSAA